MQPEQSQHVCDWGGNANEIDSIFLIQFQFTSQQLLEVAIRSVFPDAKEGHILGIVEDPNSRPCT